MASPRHRLLCDLPACRRGLPMRGAVGHPTRGGGRQPSLRRPVPPSPAFPAGCGPPDLCGCTSSDGGGGVNAGSGMPTALARSSALPVIREAVGGEARRVAQWEPEGAAADALRRSWGRQMGCDAGSGDAGVGWGRRQRRVGAHRECVLITSRIVTGYPKYSCLRCQCPISYCSLTLELITIRSSNSPSERKGDWPVYLEPLHYKFTVKDFCPPYLWPSPHIPHPLHLLLPPLLS